jgi:hypothetical protein
MTPSKTAFAIIVAAVALFTQTAQATNSCTWFSPYDNHNYNDIQLTNRNGQPIIANPYVVLDFWGSYWTTTAGSADYDRLCTATSSMLNTSSFWNRAKQYGISGVSGTFVYGKKETSLSGATPTQPTCKLTTPLLTESPATQSGTLQSLLQNEINDKTSPLPAGSNTIVVIFLPPGLGLSGHLSGSGAGYHSSFIDNNGVKVAYMVIAYSTYGTAIPSPCTPAATVQGTCSQVSTTGCNGSPGDASIETDLVAHEVLEAATDPYGAQGQSAFYADTPSGNQEIGDLCNGLSEWVAGVRWQQTWLQDQCRCDGNPFPHVSFLQGSPTWMHMPAGDSASYVGSGWVIGTTIIDNNGDYGIYRYNPAATTWSQITANGAAARQVSVDLVGNPWVINSMGQIYKWSPGSLSFQAFHPETGFKAISVTSMGTYKNDAGTWAIATDNTIWSWTGSAWRQTPNSFGTKIAIFSQSSAGDGCGAVPFVIGTDGLIYRYLCSSDSFVYANGSGPDISTDFAVDWNGNVDWWNPTTLSFNYYINAPWGTDTRIGGWSNGLFASSHTGGEIAVITGR